MEVKCSLRNQQAAAAKQEWERRIGGCSCAGYQNFVEGNTFLCKNTMGMLKGLSKDFKNRVQEQCFTLNRSERALCCLKTHKAMPGCLIQHAAFILHLTHAQLPSSEWGEWCVRLLRVVHLFILFCLCQLFSYRGTERQNLQEWPLIWRLSVHTTRKPCW